jgi:hypothetical protein
VKLCSVFSDGGILVCGGKSTYLQIWNLETHKLIKIIELPKAIKEIKEMAFLNESFDGGSHKVIYFLESISLKTLMLVDHCNALSRCYSSVC